MITNNKKSQITVLLSGRGSNLEAILAAQLFYNYQVCCVISDNKDALGLKIAEKYHVPTIKCFDRLDYPDKVSQKKNLYNFLLTEKACDLVCLAGFMQIIPPEVTDALQKKLINIHPSLLPKFPGLDTHQKVLDANELRHGATVHFVDAGVDTGKIIAQVTVSVTTGETQESLAKKVLKEEHRLYPWVIAKLLSRQIRYQDQELIYTPEATAEAQKLDFLLSK